MTQNKSNSCRQAKNVKEITYKNLYLKDEGQMYGYVEQLVGNNRLFAICCDGKKMLCHIRGKMVKRVWIKTGDIILLSLRDFQMNRADVLHRYTDDDVSKLKAMGEITNFGKNVEETNDIKFIYTSQSKLKDVILSDISECDEESD